MKRLILNDLAQEVSPHSKEVLRQEVRLVLPITHGHAQVPLTHRDTFFNMKLVTI